MRDFPDVVRIEPAGVCNFKCTHCPIGREGGHRVILPFEKFVDYFDSLPKVPRVLILYHGGEPLLNKHLERMIDYAKERGVFHIAFNTNASMLTVHRDLSRVDELRVSFDGASPEENDLIRTNSHFNLDALRVKDLALSDRRPKQIVIYNVRKNSNTPAIYLREYFKDVPGVSFRGERMRTWARLNRDKAVPKINPYFEKPDFCQALFETFTILSTGDVPMCCEDLQGEDIIGNVNTNSPQDLWERMEERRQAFSKREYPKLCQSCWIVTG